MGTAMLKTTEMGTGSTTMTPLKVRVEEDCVEEDNTIVGEGGDDSNQVPKEDFLNKRSCKKKGSQRDNVVCS